MKVFDIVFENQADELARKILARSNNMSAGSSQEGAGPGGRTVDEIVEIIRSGNSTLHGLIQSAMVHQDPQRAYFAVWTEITNAAKTIADREIERQGLTGGEANSFYKEVERKVVAAANAWMVNYYQVTGIRGTPTTKEIVFKHKQGS